MMHATIDRQRSGELDEDASGFISPVPTRRKPPSADFLCLVDEHAQVCVAMAQQKAALAHLHYLEVKERAQKTPNSWLPLFAQYDDRLNSPSLPYGPQKDLLPHKLLESFVGGHREEHNTFRLEYLNRQIASHSATLTNLEERILNHLPSSPCEAKAKLSAMSAMLFQEEFLEVNQFIEWVEECVQLI